MSLEDQAIEKIRKLNDRANRANTRIIQLNTQKEQVQKELDRANQESIDKFGTADINELRLIYRQKAEAQSQEILNFEKGVSETEMIIQNIDNSLSQLDSQNNG